MIKIFYLILISTIVCQKPLSNSSLSRRIFNLPPQDDTLTTIQMNRGGRPHSTKIFYSTLKNEDFSSNQRKNFQPTMPTNSVLMNRKKKASKKTEKQEKKKKYCLSCLTDFKTKSYNLADVCLNPLSNLTEAKLRYLSMCPETSEYCQTEVYTVNGVFSGMERRCATICVPICFQRAYGTAVESCIYCCSPYDDYETVSDDSINDCPR